MKTSQKKIDQVNANIQEKLNGDEIEFVSDGYHTFGDLYYQRMMLFAVIINEYPEKSYKSLQHSDGTMYPGYFIVGIHTPDGDFSYHYEIKYWDMFNCQQYGRAPEWDGHTEKDVSRLNSLNSWYNI